MMQNNVNPQMIAQMMMQQNPNSLNGNPNAQKYLQILMSGDAKQGEELATNLLSSMGMSKEQALQQAQSFFSNPNFMRR